MDINEAALRLKELEIIEGQIKHLQSEAARWEGYQTYDMWTTPYDIDCNNKAQELIDNYFKKK